MEVSDSEITLPSELNWNVKPDLSREPDTERLRSAYVLLSKNLPQAIEELSALAEEGSVKSMYHLGRAYRLQVYGLSDAERAQKWYERAGDGGYAIAYHELGVMYWADRKFDLARKAFRLGAQNGFVPSVYQLGRLYELGWGDAKDIDKAEWLLARAASAGSVCAKLRLSGLLRNRGGVWNTAKGIWLAAIGSVQTIRIMISEGPSSLRLMK